jgi:hypothetical protein
MNNSEENELFGIQLDQCVKSIGKLSESTTPEEAGGMQAAIYAKSAEIAADCSKQQSFQTTRPKGRMHRYKDCFSLDFRILQESLHTYVNLGRVIERLKKNKSTTISRLRELSRLYSKWRRVYNRYYI